MCKTHHSEVIFFAYLCVCLFVRLSIHLFICTVVSAFEPLKSKLWMLPYTMPYADPSISKGTFEAVSSVHFSIYSQICHNFTVARIFSSYVISEISHIFIVWLKYSRRNIQAIHYLLLLNESALRQGKKKITADI